MGSREVRAPVTDVIQVQKGSPPWSPSPDARLVKEYQFHEIPLAGVLEQHGTRYFFFCSEGADERVNLWFYTRLSPEDEYGLDAADRENFMTAVGFDGPAVMALAADDLGVIAFANLDDLSSESMQEGFKAVFDELDALTRAARELVPA
jgi:hypothetical protein